MRSLWGVLRDLILAALVVLLLPYLIFLLLLDDTYSY